MEKFNQQEGMKFDMEGKNKIEVEFPTSETSPIPLEINHGNPVTEAKKIEGVRVDLAKVLEQKKSERKQMISEIPLGITKEDSGNKPLLKKWVSVALAALGLAGASKLDAAPTNTVDQLAAAGGKTKIFQKAPAEAPSEEVFVYEQKNWQIDPEKAKVAMEHLKKTSSGGSIFNSSPGRQPVSSPERNSRGQTNSNTIKRASSPLRAEETPVNRTDNYGGNVVQHDNFKTVGGPYSNNRYENK